MQCVECAKCGETKELLEFSTDQKVIGGWCTRCQCKGTRKKAQLDRRNQKIPLGMRFTNADPRYAGRDDNKQGSDTIMTMERVREMISHNTGLKQ